MPLPSKISINVGIKRVIGLRTKDYSLIMGKVQVVTKVLDGFFVEAARVV